LAYRYETHLHTSEASLCGKSTGYEMARAHKAAGYDGIFVTDHFFNGNSGVPRNLSWEERVDIFCSGYEHAKEEGDKIGLDVFFGIEYGAGNAEFLVYNLDKEWLLAHPDFDKLPVREALSIMRRDGAVIIQPHPFRERDYVDHIELYPRDVDGVEVVNGAHINDPTQDVRAMFYAEMYELPCTCGSDTHDKDKMFGCGVETKEPIKNALDYLKFMKEGKLELISPILSDFPLKN